MLYPYDANGEGEITVPDGREVTVLEPDGKVSRFISPSFIWIY